MRTTKMLLELLNINHPPPPGAKHAITLHEGKVLIIIAVYSDNDGEAFQHVSLEDADLDRKAEDLYNELLPIMAGDFKAERSQS